MQLKQNRFEDRLHSDLDSDRKRRYIATSMFMTSQNRRQFIFENGVSSSCFLPLVVGGLGGISYPEIVNAEEKLYSSNAKNMARLAAGDSSGGSIYNNYPKTAAAAKRRAMIGCKIDMARKEAGDMNEKDCNLRVMDGDSEFMLEAMRRLDCPTCPYGVGEKK